MMSYKCVSNVSLIVLLDELIANNFPNLDHSTTSTKKKELTYQKKKLKSKLTEIFLKSGNVQKEKSCNEVSELEDLTWISYLLKQSRLFDEARNLDMCIKQLNTLGSVHDNPDLNSVLRLLILLANVKEKKKRKKVFSDWKINNDNESQHFPNIPLNFGDTTIHRSNSSHWYYTHYPKQLFAQVSLGDVEKLPKDSPINFKLCQQDPGLQYSSPLEVCGNIKGNCMNALLNLRKKPVSPDIVLSIPVLSEEGTSEICRFRESYATSSNLQVEMDEGYASSHCSGVLSDTNSESALNISFDKLSDIFPQKNNKHLPFITEAPAEAIKWLWILDQNLWGSLSTSTFVPVYNELTCKQVCNDSINLLIGISTESFPFSEGVNQVKNEFLYDYQTFTVKEGLCFPGVTPSGLLPMVQSFIDAGNYCKRLDNLTSFQYQKGMTWQGFSIALNEFLQLYRSQMLLMKETMFLQLKLSTECYIEMLIFVYNLCYNCSGKGLMSVDGEERLSGMRLISTLFNKLFITHVERDTYLLLFLLQRSIMPLFRYLERWMYIGDCLDPYNEFIIQDNTALNISKDRQYWTSKYTIMENKLSFMPPILQDVLRNVFECGKAVHFLRTFAPKHTLFKQELSDHPKIEFCMSSDLLSVNENKCQMYSQKISKSYDLLNKVNFRNLQEVARLKEKEVKKLARVRLLQRITNIQDEKKSIQKSKATCKQERLQIALEELKHVRRYKAELEASNQLENMKIDQECQNIMYKKELEEQRIRQHMESEYERFTEENEKAIRELQKKQQDILNELSVIDENSSSNSPLSEISEMSISDLTPDSPTAKTTEPLDELSENRLIMQSHFPLSFDQDINKNPQIETHIKIATDKDDNGNCKMRRSDSNDAMYSVESIATVGSMKKSKSDTFSQWRKPKVIKRPHSVVLNAEPIQLLTDQIAGDVLKQRGRNIHGHVSDSVMSLFFNSDNSSMWPIEKKQVEQFSNTELLSARNLDIPCSVSEYSVTKISPIDTNLPVMENLDVCGIVPNYIVRGISIHVQQHLEIVNEVLLSELLVKQGLLEHFENLQKVLLHQDGMFSRSLASNVAIELKPPSDHLALLTPAALNSILSEAINSSQCSKNISDHLSFVVNNVPQVVPNFSSFWDCIEMHYKINWPHSVILDKVALQNYTKLWRFLMKIHQVSYAMDDLSKAFSNKGPKEKNYRYQLFRLSVMSHEIRQFIRVVLCYVSHQAIQTNVVEFEKLWKDKVNTIDDLYYRHNMFIGNILEMCFLTDNGEMVGNILEELFEVAHEFSSVCISAIHRHEYDVHIQQISNDLIKKFRDMGKFFIKLLMKVSTCTRIGYLEAFVLQLSFNENYSLC